MPEDGTSTTSATDTGAATDTGTAATTGATPDTAARQQDSGDAVLTEIKALADELGITPGQLKGRLEASRKWEQRAKGNSDAAAQRATEADQLKQQLGEVAKILGLGDQEPTPEQMRSALGDRDKQIADRDGVIKGFRVEKAVTDAAVGAKADAALLLPALAYDGDLKALDPDADDFAAKVKAIVEAKVKANPKLLAESSFPDLRQGNQGQGASASQDPNAWLRQMAGR